MLSEETVQRLSYPKLILERKVNTYTPPQCIGLQSPTAIAKSLSHKQSKVSEKQNKYFKQDTKTFTR
jgi:hypothetical protein